MRRKVLPWKSTYGPIGSMDRTEREPEKRVLSPDSTKLASLL
ncbi:hypothetical protein [Cohnella sp. OV330]|nr:hypothetical protein [Cohnella sp. OV330]